MDLYFADVAFGAYLKGHRVSGFRNYEFNFLYRGDIRHFAVSEGEEIILTELIYHYGFCGRKTVETLDGACRRISPNVFYVDHASYL